MMGDSYYNPYGNNQDDQFLRKRTHNELDNVFKSESDPNASDCKILLYNFFPFLSSNIFSFKDGFGGARKKMKVKDDEYDVQDAHDTIGYDTGLSYIKDIHANIPPKYNQNQSHAGNQMSSSLTELIQREIGATNDQFQCRLSRDGGDYILECTRK